MSFVPLLDLSVTHTYYTNGRCADVGLAPTPETLRLARKHQCVVRQRMGGLTVIAPVDSDGRVKIPFDDALTLSFQLRLTNSSIPLFTNLEGLLREPAPLFTNASQVDRSELSLTSGAAFESENLVVPRSAPNVGMVLGGRPIEGIGPGHFAVGGTDAIRVSAYTAATRQLLLDTRHARPGESFTIRYPVQPSLERGVFANVDIHTTGVLPRAGESVPEAPRRFWIAFKAKQTKWAYYLVTDIIKPDAGTFRVIDGARAGAELHFSPANSTELGETTDPPDAVADDLARRYPSFRRVRFVSDETVPCREAARKNIALHLNGDRLYSALPNPSLHHYATLGFGDDENVERHDSLFEVVQHLTNKFPTNGA